MNVRFGNLTQPKHNTNHEDSKEKLTEMMNELHRAGFERQHNISKGVRKGKYYHIYELPHVMEIGGEAQEAVGIMQPYSRYMKPLQVVA